MELNNLKKQLQNVTAPKISCDAPTDNQRGLDDLITAMKLVDAKDRRTIWRSMLFLLLAGLFYTALVVLTWFAPPDDSPEAYRVVLSGIALAFLSIGWFCRQKSSDLAHVDYSEPVRTFLSAAERRCRFVRPRELLIVAPSLLLLAITCAAGLTLALNRYAPKLDSMVVFLAGGAIYPLAGLGGYWVGKRVWQRDREPLLRRIQSLQAALADGETAGDQDLS